MTEQFAAIKEYYKQYYAHLSMDIKKFDSGQEYMDYVYNGEPPVKRKVDIVIEDTKESISLVFSYLGIKIPAEKRGEALELINYINRDSYLVKVSLRGDGDIGFRAPIPAKTPLSGVGAVCEELARAIRDLVRKYDAQFKLLAVPAAPAAPAPAAEEKKRSANDPEDRWSVDFG